MSKPSRRPNREQIKAQRKERKRAQKTLREELKRQGFNGSSHGTISNHKCEYKNVEEERAGRNEATWEQLSVFRAKLPVLLGRLSKIPEPRNPRKIKHKPTVLLIYGILVFVLQMSSSREANRGMSRPMFWENLKLLFPELEDVPHHDTLKRLLQHIDVGRIAGTASVSWKQFLITNQPVTIVGDKEGLATRSVTQAHPRTQQEPPLLYDEPAGNYVPPNRHSGLFADLLRTWRMC